MFSFRKYKITFNPTNLKKSIVIYFLPVFFSIAKHKLFTKLRTSCILFLFPLAIVSEHFYISLKYFCEDYFKWQPKIFKCVFTMSIWWKEKERWSLLLLLEPEQCSVAHKIIFPPPTPRAWLKGGDSNCKFVPAKRQLALPLGLQCGLSNPVGFRREQSEDVGSLKDLSFHTAVHRGRGLGFRSNMN